ncbi:MAG: glycosyltransferase family 39 protein [Planctomycetaceae bacterium]|nr:glycosyltransferase family 39 protein [Planctomycetaceae bacterium]
MKSAGISVVLAAAAFFLAAARINPGLVDSDLPSGPGLTLDESFNIGQGVYLFESFLDHGPLLFTPSGAEDVFGAEGYLPDHPPLARFMLGAAHQLTAWVIPGAELGLFNVPAARLGSCVFLAMTVLVLVEFVRRRYGLATAVLSAVCFLLMPRVIGHARIAAQETTTTFFWLAAIVPLLTWWTKDRPPTLRQTLVSGVLFGLLMAAKIQAVFVPPVLLVFSLVRHRHRAIVPLAVWGVTGFVVFFVLWPWLWLDPVEHLLQYIVKTKERPTLYVWYLGRRYADQQVPFHYPFVMLLATTPLAVVLGFGWRLVQRKLDRVEVLSLATVVFPLCVFALPGTPVYDSARLFLVVTPLLAFLSARGLVSVWQTLPEEVSGVAPSADNTAVAPLSRRRRSLAIVVYVIAIIVSVQRFSGGQPFCLEEYSLTVGGTRVAVEKLGLEASYWAEGLNADFWEQVPEDSTVYVTPVSHQFQLTDVQQLVPIVQQRNINLQPFLYDATRQRGLLLQLHRLADLPPGLRGVPKGAAVIAEAKYRGVVLARLVDTTDANWTQFQSWPADQQ